MAYRQLAKEFLSRRREGAAEEDDEGGGFKLKSPFEKPIQMDAPAFVSAPIPSGVEPESPAMEVSAHAAP